MSVVHKSVLLEYSADQMFSLVERVEDYPKFLPWCGGVTVAQREADTLVATLTINYHGIRQSFTTKNVNLRPSSMTMTLTEGPFKHLDGEWRFKPLRDNACRVDFDLRYEFSNKLIETIIGSVFDKIANSFVDSFCKRAEEVYGKN